MEHTRKTHTVDEILNKISKERYNELFVTKNEDELFNSNEKIKDEDLCPKDRIKRSIASNSQDSIIEKYMKITDVYESLKNDIEKDLFEASIAFSDDDLLVSLIKVNGINIEDLVIINSKASKNKELKKQALQKIEKFRMTRYPSTLPIHLINKLNLILAFNPKLLTTHEELNEIIKNHLFENKDNCKKK